MARLIFPLNITLESPRPIFKAYINEIPIKCMLDTGADIAATFRNFNRTGGKICVFRYKNDSFLVRIKI